MNKIFPLILVLLLIYPVFAQNKVIEPITPEKKGVFSGLIATILKYWIWFAVIVVAIIFIVFIVILIKKMKKREDPFKKDFVKVKKLCKFTRDPTIKQVYMVSDNSLTFLGRYIGECFTNDGFRNILLFKFKKWYLFWIPLFLDFFDIVKDDFIVRCNMNKVYKYRWKDPESGKEEIKEVILSHDIVYKDGDKLIIRGFGMERVRYFFYPVLRDTQGNIVDKKLEIFARERDSALIDVLYNQTEDFANVSRQIIQLNPAVRFHQKTGELPSKKE
jgi:hypothetical protein